MPAWIGLALLSVSWLVGLHYYHATDWPAWSITLTEGAAPLFVVPALWIHMFWWAITVAAGTALLATRRFRLPDWRSSALALLMVLPAIWLMPWPYRAATGLVGAGLLLAILSHLWEAGSVAPPVMSPGDPSDAFVSPDEVVPVVPASYDPSTRWWFEPKLSRDRWLSAVAGTCLLAGCVLLVQSLAMFLYETVTARSHDLPAVVAWGLAAVLRALGVDAAAGESSVTVFSMRKIHHFAATWELLLDPPTWCFLVSGLLLSWWKSGPDRPTGESDGPITTTTNGTWRPGASYGRIRRQAGVAARFVLLMVAWLPFRAALLIAVYLDRVLRVDYDAPLDSMKLFWNPWVLLAMLAGPVLLAWANCRRQSLRGAAVPAASGQSGAAVPAAPGRRDAQTTTFSWTGPNARYALSVVLTLAAVGLVGLGLFWEPAGPRKPGRVLVEECYPRPELAWERADRPYDTNWYGNMSGYNYYCIFDYCKRYYDVARQTTPLDDAALENCDILVLKTPSRSYSADEVDAVVRFVERGGGLMMIGEHTDVPVVRFVERSAPVPVDERAELVGCGTALNGVARRFGFSYRFDCLFGIDSVFEEHFDPPLAPHPIIQYLPGRDQYMPGMDFAISCSIDPGTSRGRAAICNTGLKSLMADYHADNFYPEPVDSAEMRYGAFVQLWAVQHGRGRVAAFTDSTVFSNFCTFEPGKSELMLGMLEWLNHVNSPIDPRPWLLIAGLLLLPVAVTMSGTMSGTMYPWSWSWSRSLAARGGQAGWIMLVAAGLLGWSLAVVGSWGLNQRAVPPPPRVRPLVEFSIDRTLCDCPLSSAGFITLHEQPGFGIFERWILRLGYFTARRNVPKVFTGDAIVFCYPHLPLPRGFRDKLVQYVREGGKVLVVDSVENKGSTANDLLEPFGLALDSSSALSGPLKGEAKWPSIAVTDASPVKGGEPFAWVEGRPVAARASFGEGSVTVLGFGSRFTDANMGGTGDVVPDDELRRVYDVRVCAAPRNC